MANLQDYVRWRGDITFAERGFNLVDNLVLAAISNVDFHGLVPSTGATFAQIAEWVEVDLEDRRLVWVPRDLLVTLGGSARFGGARVHHYVDRTHDGVQFAAITIDLPDGTSYVSFRGTDNTIVGWREDFAMSFEAMPSQDLAEEYLSTQLTRSWRQVRVGGHSKGGNLAQYAASALTPSELEQVVAVYSNDGPGLAPEAVAEADLLELGDKLIKIIPEYCIIGRLFDDTRGHHVVSAAASGIMQHDIMSWQVLGDSLVEAEAESPMSAWVSQTVEEWLREATPSDRRQLTNALFDSLSAGGATLVQDVPARGHGSWEQVLASLASNRDQLRSGARTAAKAMGATLRRLDWRNWMRRTDVIQPLIGVLVGLLFLIVPEATAGVVGVLAGPVVCLVVVVRLISFVGFLRHEGHRLRWGWVLVGVGVFAALAVGLAYFTALTVPVNLVLAVVFIADSWHRATEASQRLPDPRRRTSGLVLGATAVMSLLFGVVALTDRPLPLYVAVAGAYLAALGLMGLFTTLRDTAANVDWCSRRP